MKKQKKETKKRLNRQ